MRHSLCALAIAAGLGLGLPAQADSIGDVEGARAHERQGGYLTRQEREKLRRYGGNDDSFYSGRRGYGYRGGSVGIYVGPGYGGHGYGYSSPYYGPYGY